MAKNNFSGDTPPQGGTIFDLFEEVERKNLVKSIERGDYSKGCNMIKKSIMGGNSIEDLIKMLG